MRIKKIELKNFKRFSDLTIGDIPETSKLVLLIGSNGSGKSSLFDAFDWLSRGQHKLRTQDWINYYPKTKDSEPSTVVEFYDGSLVEKIGDLVSKGREITKKFFGRSSIRIVPKITNESKLSQVLSDQDSPDTYIQNDRRFINDIALYIDNIDQALRGIVFRGEDVNPKQIFRESIEPLNESLLNIFGGNKNTTIQIHEYFGAKNQEPAKLIFKKGSSEINYDLLSHGEKQVVILLINFIVRQDLYKDSIIFIDEMDCHLNTSLQYSLLKEIVERWIPDNSQLWTASHALGFIDYAKQSYGASTIDFDLLDFDQPQTLIPLTKDDLDVYEIAIPKEMFSKLLFGKEIILCEGQNDKLYSKIGFEDKVFSGVDGSGLLFLKIKNLKDENIKGLRDRDWLSDIEIQRIKQKYPNYKILNYRNFENYLYHPDNLSELDVVGFDKEKYIDGIIKRKTENQNHDVTNIASSRRNYEEFKGENENLKDMDNKEIVDDFFSNSFEKFYKFYDMKKNKEHYSKFNLSEEKLVKTKWFKKQIASILE